MSDEKQQPQTPQVEPAQQQAEKPKAQPSYDAFAVQEDRSGKSHFKNIGAAFAHKDGHGHTIEVAATPVNGRVVLRTPKERLDKVRDNSAEPQQRENDHGRE